MPTVSVIVPAYNQGRYLGQSIHSVLDQTYQDFEILVVDDGSTDNTRQVVASFDDPRLRYVYQQNRGLSAARNAGLRQTGGPLLGFLDSDDIFLPENLEGLTTVLESEPETGLVAGQTIRFDDAGRQLDETPYPSKPLSDSSQLLLGNPMAVGSMLLRRSWLAEVGSFDENLRALEDWDLWLRLAHAGCPMKWIQEPVLLYRFHAAQMTNEGERLCTAGYQVLDKVYDNPEELPESWLDIRNRAYANLHLRAAAQSYREGAFETAKSNLGEAVRLDSDLCTAGAEQMARRFSAWADDPRTGNRLQYLEQVYANLPNEVAVMHDRRRQDLARAAMQLALAAYRRRDLATARSAILHVFRYQPGWCQNRGALSILIRSCLGCPR